MIIKEIRWEKYNRKDRRPINHTIRGYIEDKIVAIIIEDINGDCAHFIKFYEKRQSRKDKTFRIHKSLEKAKKFVQDLFNEFIAMSIEEQ